MVEVAYRDFAPAYQDLNQPAGCISPRPACRRLRRTTAPAPRKLLFVTNRERAPQAPDVATAREQGYPDLTFEGVSASTARAT